METAVSTESPTETATRAGSLMGTVAYMSSEQAQGRPVDPRSDVFSLGVLLYEMFTGRRPFGGDNTVSILSSILRDAPQEIRELKQSAPSGLQRIVGRCLEKDPAKRYATAGELREEMVGLRESMAAAGSARATRTKFVGLAVGAIVVIAALAFGVRWLGERDRVREEHREALAELERVVEQIQFLEEGPDAWQAYRLASSIPAGVDDARLEELWPEFTHEGSIVTDPPGARVSIQYYGDPDGEWVDLGRTPLEGIRYPRGFTRLRIELDGYRTVRDLVWNFLTTHRDLSYPLHGVGDLPEEMEWVPGGTGGVAVPGLAHIDDETFGAFLMDRREVTNAEYKRFVEDRGYERAELWSAPFVERGRELPREEALARLTDGTGRPGPAGWEVGDFPEGEDALPVTGVTWYEAAAYCAWADKSLPTLFHWSRVAMTWASAQIIPQSNLAGDRLLPAGSTAGENRFGISDLAGNAREWVRNASNNEGERFLLGGGWDDPDYAFASAYAQLSFDRSRTNGFRCIRELSENPNETELARTIERQVRDFMSETPVSDEVFALFANRFEYDPIPLDAAIEDEIEVAGGVRQKVTFNAAYGGERMIAYLYLPEETAPPYQTVVLFPGSGAKSMRSSESIELGRSDFLLKSGRAVIYPLYKGTYERGVEGQQIDRGPSNAYREHVVMWGKDLARSIDYLESRDDIDSERIAYFGLSWGAMLGAIMPAVEDRIRANVLYVAGLGFQMPQPEANAINYIGRVTQPTLMLCGELDFFFPVETSQRPMYELLGTPEEHKKWLVYPGGHSVPRADMIRETLDWLDRYLGPVG
jgi:dienelactone hydrolase